MKSDEEILVEISRTGQVDADLWNETRQSLLQRLEEHVDILFQNLRTCFPNDDDINPAAMATATSLDLQSDRDITNRLISTLASFDNAPPFTIQRITELILHPNHHHTKKAKYLRALDRTLTVTSTTDDYPPADANGTQFLTEQLADLPLFSPIPWASANNPNERYPSPSLDATAAAVIYPLANGVNGRDGESHDPTGTEVSAVDGSPTQMSSSAPPPIDAVDIGIVPESLARAAQEGGPPPRGPQDVNVSVEDREMNGDSSMDIE